MRSHRHHGYYLGFRCWWNVSTLVTNIIFFRSDILRPLSHVQGHSQPITSCGAEGHAESCWEMSGIGVLNSAVGAMQTHWKIWLFGVERGLMLPSHRYHRFDMRIKYHQPFWGSGLLNQSVQWHQCFDWMAALIPLQSVIWSQFPHSDTGIPVPGNLCKNVFPVVWLGRWSFLFDVRLWLGGWPGSSSPPKRWYNLKKNSSSSDSSVFFFDFFRIGWTWNYHIGDHMKKQHQSVLSSSQ